MTRKQEQQRKSENVKAMGAVALSENQAAKDAAKMDAHIELTAEEKAAKNRANFIRHLALYAKHSEETLAEWETRFRAAPLYALEYSDNTFESAAMLCLSKRVLMWFEKEVSIDDIRSQLEDRVIRSLQNSTSITSNLVDRCNQQVAVRILRDFRKVFGKY